MNTTVCESIGEDISLDELNDSQKHILTSVYKNKVRDFINNAIDSGDDISLDEEGNILCLQTKFYVRKYEWNPKIQDFIKVRTQGRRNKNTHEAMTEEEEEYVMEEFAEK